jgi:hypothetical protein
MCLSCWCVQPLQYETFSSSLVVLTVQHLPNDLLALFVLCDSSFQNYQLEGAVMFADFPQSCQSIVAVSLQEVAP